MRTTNNRMELEAAINGLLVLTESCSVTVITDSKYLQQGVTVYLVPIGDRFSTAVAPAAALPTHKVQSDPLLQILGIGDHRDPALFSQDEQSVDRSRQFHPVVRRPQFYAVKDALVLPIS